MEYGDFTQQENEEVAIQQMTRELVGKHCNSLSEKTLLQQNR